MILNNFLARSIRIFLAATALFTGSVFAGMETSKAVSQEVVPARPAPEPFEFRLGLPGWMAGLSGELGVRGVSADLDVKFTEILERLEHIPLVLSLYGRYERWEFFADGQYLKLSDSAELPGLLFSRADAEVESAFVEAFVGYRVISSERAVLSLYAGARYNYLSSDLQVFDNGDPRFPILRRALGIPDSLRVSGSEGWVDPVIGIGGKVRIARPVMLYAKGDIGGFGAASDFAWQVQGGFEFQITRWLYSNVAWRYMKFDYTSGGFTNKTELNGPLLEVGVKF